MTKLEAFKRLLREEATPDDVVEGLLGHFEGTAIVKDPERIHRAFCRLKPSFPELFRDFLFDTSGPVPYSRMLDRVLFRLETSTVLGTINPQYVRYEISTDTKAALRNAVQHKFRDDVKEQLIRASRTLEGLIRA